MKKLIALGALALASPALAQNSPSGSQRVQGVPDGYGDPVQVTIVGADGSDAQPIVTARGAVADNGVNTAANQPVPSGCEVASSKPTFSVVDIGTCRMDTRGNMYVTLGAQDSGQQLTDTNGVVVQAGLSSSYWYYTNGNTGILSNTTTAVTMKTAAGASVRNYIDSCTINTTAFGAAVPLSFRDGAGGTVIFSLNVPTGGFLTPINIEFKVPLRSTANTLLEVVTPTANTSGTVWVNCQGHTGA